MYATKAMMDALRKQGAIVQADPDELEQLRSDMLRVRSDSPRLAELGLPRLEATVFIWRLGYRLLGYDNRFNARGPAAYESMGDLAKSDDIRTIYNRITLQNEIWRNRLAVVELTVSSLNDANIAKASALAYLDYPNYPTSDHLTCAYLQEMRNTIPIDLFGAAFAAASLRRPFTIDYRDQTSETIP